MTSYDDELDGTEEGFQVLSTEPEDSSHAGPSFGEDDTRLEADVYEAFANNPAKDQRLSWDQFEKLATRAKHPDQEIAEMAMSRLVTHNIRWIISVATKYAGKRRMNQPGELRNDLLAEARMGFLEGIKKYDAEAAVKKGTTNNKKSVLVFTEYWIRKRVASFLRKETYRMGDEAALDRNRVLKAEARLGKSLGRRPTDEEIEEELTRIARRKAHEKGLDVTDETPLGKFGAIPADRVRDLREHRTSTASLDGSVGDSPEEGMTLADVLDSEEETPLESVAQLDRQARVSAHVEMLPDPMSRISQRMSYGLPNRAGTGHYGLFNDDEIAFIRGVTRDTARSRRREAEEWLRGEASVGAEDVRHPDRPRSVKGWKDHPDPDRRLQELAAILDMSEVRDYYGQDGDTPLPCGDASCLGSLEEATAAAECNLCGRQHSPIEMVASAASAAGVDLKGKDPALEEAYWVAAGIPLEVRESAKGKVLVTTDPVRKRKLRELL